MDFFLLILVSGVLIVRPTDFVPELEVVPLYQIFIVPCILLSWNRLLSRLSPNALREDPVVLLMVGILLVSLISNLAGGYIETAIDFGTEFVKIILFYLLLLGIVDSPARLRRYLACLVGFDLIPTILALLQYQGMINIPAFTALDENGVLRLHATGNFGDPNDFCEILNTAALFSLYQLMEGNKGVSRFLWVAPVVVLGVALVLTKSRGGLLGASAGLFVMFMARYGVRKAVMVAALAVPIMLVIFSGRQTSLSTSEGTSQQRIQLWTSGFEMLRESPVFGVGVNQFAKRVGYVAHNSFVHTFAELGLLGGTFFFGTYYYVIKRVVANWLVAGNRPRHRRSPDVSLCHGGRSELRGESPVIIPSLYGHNVRDLGCRSGLCQIGSIRVHAC